MTPDEALKHLTALGEEYKAAQKTADALKAQVDAAIVTARRTGATPTATENASPYSSATTRKVTRAAGIEPGEPGGERVSRYRPTKAGANPE